MVDGTGLSIQTAFGDMDDPRVVGRCTYPLSDIILIAICGALCGAESWTEIEEFGESKAEWLGKFLKLGNGIPSHDTFRRVFSILAAAAFQERFRQ